jgi:hypothetical protein
MSIKNFLRNIGLISKPEEPKFENIPEDSLGFSEILEEVQKMNAGESKEFKFNPLDPVFRFGANYVGANFAMKVKKPVALNFTVDLEKGIYLMKITVFG